MKQKRIISFILAMVMVFGIFTEAAVPVYAALEEESTVTAVVPTDDETIADDTVTDETGTEEAPVEGSCGDSLTWAFDAGTGTLAINGSGAMYDYEIDYNTLTTTAPWIGHKDSITSLVLSDEISYIGNHAFALCGSIKGNLVIPDSVTGIGMGAFINCWGFDGTLTLPANLAAIGESAFENCSGFTGKLEIPSSVTVISPRAFYGCGFRELVIPEGVTSIGDSAFFRNGNITGVLTIPAAVQTIEAGAFAGCSGITEIVFAGTAVPALVTTFASPFDTMTALTKIQVPAASYDAYAAALTGMVADTVEIVKYGEEPPVTETFTITVVQNENGTVAVDKTTAVAGETVTITATPDENYEIDVIFVDGDTLDSNSFTVTGNHIVSVTFKAAESAEPTPEPVPGGSCGDNLTWTIEDNTLTISGTGPMYDYNYSMYGPSAPWYSELQEGMSLVIEEGVTSIGNYAFVNCKKLTGTLVLPEGLSRIGNYAFMGCSGLGGELVIPDSLTSMGDGVFSQCTNFNAIVFGSGIAEIPDVFNYDNVTELVLRNPDVTTAPEGYTALESADALKTVYVPAEAYDAYVAAYKDLVSETVVFSTLESYEFTEEDIPGRGITWSFDEITGTLTISGTGDMYKYSYDQQPWYAYLGSVVNLVVEEGVTSLNAILCDWSVGSVLENVTLPSTLKAIGASAFSGCSALKEVTLPEGLTKLGYTAFHGCSSLESIRIPAGVKTVPQSAFVYCSSLTELYIPEGVETIGFQAFDGCSALTYVILPQSIKAIDTLGFGGGLTDIYYAGTQEQWAAVELAESAVPDVVMHYGTIYNLTLQQPENGTIAVRTSMVTAGETVDVTATPRGGYRLDKIYVDGTAIDGTVFTVTGNHTVTAVFTEAETVLEGSCGDNLTWSFDEATGTLTISGSGAMNNYTSRTAPWIAYKDNIVSLVIENGATTIGNYAFDGHTSLSSVTIPESVTSIGNYAFYSCSSLQNITIPSNVSALGGFAFCLCSSLESITIPDGITDIEFFLFSDCTALIDVNIPQSVTNISANAFAGCVNLENVIYKGTRAQWDEITIAENNTSLTDATIICTGEGITNKHNVTFDVYIETFGEDGSTSLERYYYETITVEAGLPIDLPEFEIPDGYSISDEWFYTADNGETGVWDLANYTVTTDLSLTTNIYKDITITFDVQGVGETPDPVTAKKYAEIEIPQPSAEGYTFKGWFFDAECEAPIMENTFASDTTLYASWEEVSEESAPMESGTCGYNATYKLYDTDSDGTGDKLLISGTGELYTYAFSGNGSIETVEISDGITGISDGLFYNCTALADIALPDSVTYIGAWAFIGCAALTDIRIPENVTEMGSSAFSGCSSLTAANIPDGVTTISPDLFRYCSSLETVEISDNITSVGDYAFSECTSLKNISLPAGVTYIGNAAFHYCSSLTSMDIPDSVTYIGESAFYGCSLMETVDMPAGITEISNDAFANCSALKSIKIPGSVTAIGANAFDGCTALTEIIIPEGVETIGNRAFSYCENVTAIDIPDTVTSIGRWAFCGCRALTEITIPYGVSQIGDATFYFCSSLRNVIIPDSVTSIGKYAFFDCYSLESIVIPDGAAAIGQETFLGCSALTEVTIPESVTEIGIQAFNYCNALETVNFKGSRNQWSNITVAESNDVLSTAQIVYGKYDITTAECENGTVAVNKAVAAADETVTVTATADQYYELDKVIVNGEEIEGTTFAVQADSVVTAVFKVAGMDKPVSGLTAEKVFSKTVVLTWEPYECPLIEGYEIIRDGEVIATTTECTFTDRSLTADTRYSYSVLAYTGSQRTPLAGISVETATPEIREIYVDNKLDKVNDEFNRIYIKVSDNKNLGGLGEEKTTAELYLAENTERVLLGELEINEELSNQLTAVYTYDWDISAVEDGEYQLVFVLTDADGTAAEMEKTVEVDRSLPEKIVSFVATGTVKDIVLSWTISTEVDTTVYRIYKKAAEEDGFSLLKEIEGRNILAYNDTDVEANIGYEYYIVGVNSFDNEGEASDIVSAQLRPDIDGPVVTKLTPGNLTFISGTEEFVIKAEDNLAVTRAELYYSADEKETWTLLAEADENFTASVDTTTMPEGVVYIKAMAYDAAGNASDGLTYKYNVDNTGPQQVQGLTYESTSVTVTLKWDDVEDEDFAFFRVEQKNDDGTYTKVSDVTTTLGLNIYNLEPDSQYTYRVTAYDNCDNAGVPSEDIVVTTLSDTTAPVITDIRPEPGSYSDNIELSITAKDEFGIAEITVQVATDTIDWNDVYTETYAGENKTHTLKYTLSLESYDEGIINVRGIAKDIAGNISNDGVDAPCVQYNLDRTAPEAPTIVQAEGNCGYIEVFWTQEESDVGSYSVYRAEAEDGEYQLIKADIKALNYFDRAVEEDITYFYRVSVTDAAGNSSDLSAEVSAASTADTSAPEIYSISPKAESKLGTGYRKVGARILDNMALLNVSVEYSKDGENYTVLLENTDIGHYSMIAEADIPVEEFADGETVYVKFTATDMSGNTFESKVTYIVDATAPEVYDVTAEFVENEVIVSWTGGSEDDLAGYRIYRKTTTEEYGLIGQCVTGETAVYSWSDADLSEDEITYFYKIVAVDKVGNTSEIESEAITLQERGIPLPVIACDNAMEIGVEYIIDGSQSSDNSAIVSYLFDFGDGTTSTKVKPVHKYEEAGEYIITLTVTDDDGNEATTTKTVTVTERKLIGTVKVFVVDEAGVAVPGASVYFDLGEDSQVKKYTDKMGYVTFTAEAGKHKIGAVIPDNEWLPMSEEVIVRAGEEVLVSLTMVHQPLIEGEFTVNRMTLEEIEAAGIDPTLPENQHIFKVDISLMYDDIPITIPTTYNPKTKEFKGNGGGGYGGVPGLGLLNIAVIDIDKESEAPTKIALFQTPAEGSFLKEFFDVRLHIINNSSPEYKMTDNVISLNVPEGLTIIDTDATEGSDIVKIDEIAGGTTETIAWIFRGDTEGEYDLTADYSGTLSEFNEQIHTQFITAEPIKVYGMSAVKLIAEANSTIYYGAFYFNLSLENTSSIYVYLPKLDITESAISEYFLNLSDDSTGIEYTEPELKKLNTYLYNSAGLATPIGRGNDVTRLAPGEKLTHKYVVYNVTDRDNVLYLKKAVIKAADDCGIQCEIRSVNMDLYNLDNIEEKFEAFNDAYTSNPALSMFDYIRESKNFLYPHETLYRTYDVENQLSTYTYMAFAKIFKDFNYKSNQVSDATRALLIRLLTEETFTQSVEERMMEKYTNVMIPLLNMVSAAFVDGSIESTVSSEGLKYISELSGDSAKVQKLIGAMREDGEEGFVEELETILTSYGVGIIFKKASLMNFIKDRDYKDKLTSQFKGMDKVVKQLDAITSAWYKTGDIADQLMYISAVGEEAEFLLEELIEWTSMEWYVKWCMKWIDSLTIYDIESVENIIHDELVQIKADITGGYERLALRFAEELAKEEIQILGEAGIKKAIIRCFGAEGYAIYALLKTAFNIVDQITGWGDHVEANLKLDVDYAISLAIESALNVRYNEVQTSSAEDRPEKIMDFMKTLKYMIKMRMIGEQDFDDLAVDQTIKDTDKVLDTFNAGFEMAMFMNSDISRDQKAEVGVWFPIVLDWMAEKLGETTFECITKIYDAEMLWYIQQRADTIYTEDDLRQAVVDYTYKNRLAKVNNMFGVEYKNVDEYLDATISRLVEYRDSIFSVYYENLVVPDAPAIELDYLNYCTVDSYSTDYVYSFDGSTWYGCTGSQIKFEPSNVMKWLWVRSRGTETEPAGNIAKIAIPAMTILTGDFKMVYDGGTYKVSGLPAGTYQYVFTNDRSILTFTDTFTVAEGETVELMESAGWTYLAVQTAATETSFASQILYLTKYNAWVVDEEDRQITKLMESTTKEDLLTYYRNMGEYVAFKTAMDTIGELIATGDIIQIGISMFKAVVSGDVDGDAYVTIDDLNKMISHANDEELLEAEYLDAGCITEQEDIDLFDVFAIINYIETGSFAG